MTSDSSVTVTDKGKAQDMSQPVTAGLDKMWRYTVDFEDMPKVVRNIEAKGGEWTLEDAYPHEARVEIAVSVEL